MFTFFVISTHYIIQVLLMQMRLLLNINTELQAINFDKFQVTSIKVFYVIALIVAILIDITIVVKLYNFWLL